MPHARTVMERIAALARISEHPDYLMRRSYTPAMREANALVAGWMEGAGMAVRRDHTGNLIGRYATADPDAPTFIFGSHLDTVRDAGAFDGPLGILLAIAAVERLGLRRVELPFHVEIIAFADEEGIRWGTAYLGSKAIAGTFESRLLDPDYPEIVDAEGIGLAAAMRAFGADPDHITDDCRDPARILGYCEVHIEQGPVLEAHDLPVGIVTAIAGQSRFAITFEGVAGHAGTVPMSLRHDALCDAAEFVLFVESYARATPGLVATVGNLTVKPGASNVIPGHVALTLDVRHAEDAVRLEACRAFYEYNHRDMHQRSVGFGWHTIQETAAVICDARFSKLLAHAAAQPNGEPFYLPSGAGHDAVAMAELAPVAMLFVRCKGGVSHNPAESVEERDVAYAIDVLVRFIAELAATEC